MRAYAVLLAHHYAMEYFSVSVRYIVHVDMIVSRPAAYSRVAPRRTQDTYDTSACNCERMGEHIDKQASVQTKARAMTVSRPAALLLYADATKSHGLPQTYLVSYHGNAIVSTMSSE